MSSLENEAIQIIRTIEERWPLEPHDLGRLGEFLALQFMRTPAWRTWHEHAVEDSISRLLAEDPQRKREPLEQAAAVLVGDAERHERLINNLASLGTLFANMYWTLLRTGSERLATSDHPLVPVSFTDEMPAAVSPLPVEGTFATSEYRFALTPRLLLLMTWWDVFDEAPISKMQHAHIRDHNGLVAGQAEHQWFYYPGRRPERKPNRFNPISADLYRPLGYYPDSFRKQVIRQAVGQVNAEPEPRTGLRVIDWGSVPRVPS